MDMSAKDERKFIRTVSPTKSSIPQLVGNWVDENFPWKSTVDRRELVPSHTDLNENLHMYPMEFFANTYG